MKRVFAVLFALSVGLVLWASAKTSSRLNPRAIPTGRDSVAAGNIAEGMYTIEGWASKRCLEVPNSSCASGVALQIFDCDRTGVSNHQKFNVASDGSGNYTISPANSDLCLEVSAEKVSDRKPILQTECSAGKVSQKWAMSQYGDNLEIRDVQNNQCIDILRKWTANYAPVFLQACNDGTNQRWTLHKTTLNTDQGIICKDSPSHPTRNCSGVNDQQKEIQLGKTLTKARCDDACKVNKMVSCKWEGAK